MLAIGFSRCESLIQVDTGPDHHLHPSIIGVSVNKTLADLNPNA
jgi:hypothetical protein